MMDLECPGLEVEQSSMQIKRALTRFPRASIMTPGRLKNNHSFQTGQELLTSTPFIQDGHVRFVSLIHCGAVHHLIASSRFHRSNYYDKHYRQSAALIRARQPYLVKNIFTGLGLCAFTIAVCTLRSVSNHLATSDLCQC